MPAVNTELYPKIFLYRRLVQAKLFMDAHYADSIGLDHIAGEACCSKFHFVRQFTSVYRKTPHQYLIAVRMAKAKALLNEGMAVGDVCTAVGFESLGSFSGLFKRVYGESPQAYQKKQAGIRAEVKRSPLSFIPSCFADKNGWM